MSSTNEQSARPVFRELKVLEEIERNPSVSQRQLASDLGVAVGVANTCVNTLVRKGLIKIRGESNRSITYHLTKQGLAQKARLALEWTNNTIGFYLEARRNIRTLLDRLAAQGVEEVVLFGANEAAELVAMISGEADVRVAAVVRAGDETITGRVAGIDITDLPSTPQHGADAVIVCLDPSAVDRATLVRVYPGAIVVDLSGNQLREELQG